MKIDYDFEIKYFADAEKFYLDKAKNLECFEADQKECIKRAKFCKSESDRFLKEKVENEKK
jgi:hypothetical protein